MSFIDTNCSRAQVKRLISWCETSPEQVRLGEAVESNLEALLETEEGVDVITNLIAAFPFLPLEGTISYILDNLTVYAFKAVSSKVIECIATVVLRNETRIALKNFIETYFDKLILTQLSCELVIKAIKYWPSNFTSKIVKKLYGRFVESATNLTTYPLARTVISKASPSSQAVFLKEIQAKKAFVYLMTNQWGKIVLLAFIESAQYKTRSSLLSSLERNIKTIRDKSVREFWLNAVKNCYY